MKSPKVSAGINQASSGPGLGRKRKERIVNKMVLWLAAALSLTACGATKPEVDETEQPLLPQKVLLPFSGDSADSFPWHKGNWHGSTNNPFPPYCPLDSSSPWYYCIYDMQAHGDTDTDDRDHLWVAGGQPPWGTDEFDAGGAQMALLTKLLFTQISASQFDQITAIDYMEMRITGSVIAPPYGAAESVTPLWQFNGWREAGDPQYITQDGAAHEVVWQWPTDQNGQPWNKNTHQYTWGFTNGNPIGANRAGGLFVHSMQVYIGYH
jgi:hypothetical protein